MNVVASSRAPRAGDHRVLLLLGVPSFLIITGVSLREVVTSEPGPVAALAVAGAALFSALFLWLVAAPRMDEPESRLLLVNLLMLGLAVTLMPTSSVFLAAAAAMAGDSLRPRLAGPIIVVAAVGTAVNGLRADLDVVEAVTAAGIAAAFGMLTMGMRRLAMTNHDLVAAREEVARLAVVEERLRFARDLHDLLGHSLTVIRAKAELATRVASTDPARAAAEMAEVELLAREALADVRETVMGHRRRRLDTELHSARDALEAAGITPHIAAPSLDLAPEVDDALAFVLREGVTNVIRHSGASECRVEAACDDGTVRLVVADNGRGAAVDAGTGLTGVRERLADIGGTLAAGPRPGPGAGGFELVASVPSDS